MDGYPRCAAPPTLPDKYTLNGNWSNNEETAGCGYVANRSVKRQRHRSDIVANLGGLRLLLKAHGSHKVMPPARSPGRDPYRPQAPASRISHYRSTRRNDRAPLLLGSQTPAPELHAPPAGSSGAGPRASRLRVGRPLSSNGRQRPAWSAAGARHCRCACAPPATRGEVRIISSLFLCQVLDRQPPSP